MIKVLEVPAAADDWCGEQRCLCVCGGGGGWDETEFSNRISSFSVCFSLNRKADEVTAQTDFGLESLKALMRDFSDSQKQCTGSDVSQRSLFYSRLSPITIGLVVFLRKLQVQASELQRPCERAKAVMGE